MGSAIWDYHSTGKAAKLIVKSSMFDDDEIPVETLFRSFEQMPELEKLALQQSRGKILDVGAGSGCHSIALQQLNKTVTAIDISPLAVQTMRERGVKDVQQVDFFASQTGNQYDTVLLLMNGTGIIGKIENLDDFFNTIDKLLAPGGQVLVDSSDLKYLYEEEDGSFLIDVSGDYYGEVDFLMVYKGIVGEPFDWLYLDSDTFAAYAEKHNFKLSIISEGEHFDYLAKIERNII